MRMNNDCLKMYDCSEIVKDIKAGKLEKIKVQPVVGMKVIAMTCSGISAIEISEIQLIGFSYNTLDINLERMSVQGYSPAPQFYKILEDKPKKTLTRENIIAGLDALKNFLLVGNDGIKLESSSTAYQDTVKSIHVLEEELDIINEAEYKEQGKEFFSSTPCRHTVKAKKESKPKKEKAPKVVKEPKQKPKWNKTNIKALLETNTKMVHKSIVKIYECQTLDEQQIGDTNHNNGVGFNGVDAYIMSSFAKQILAGRTLSVKQIVIARTKIKKYAGQLAKIANEMEADKVKGE